VVGQVRGLMGQIKGLVGQVRGFAWLSQRFFSSSAGVSLCISLKIKKRHYEHHMTETHR
jgi:hypothetical protein